MPPTTRNRRPGGSTEATVEGTTTTSIAQTGDIPDDLAALRAMVRRVDPVLRKALRDLCPTPQEVEDLRTDAARRRIELRRREAEQALSGLRGAA